ncbi:hypothetical protein [Paractinoplanes durhamensis]|uniref:Uncharacterized protein n=1 Tax=Paractinoplanes durhamensis TaxID=113563 RepID=A0ABQ3YP60_9ACTN|nr:hypothetical protein [Actinoplanes durhamensis]GID99371.1 hypothetical protein Adu01nite_07220 [Actinoplanes durhamensis]
MNPLDLLARRRESAIKNDPDPSGHIELRPSDHEEPTWEIRHPTEVRRRRLDGRTRAILSAAAIIAVVVNAGAAWVYWRITGSETGHTSGGTAIVLALRARSDLNRPLTPGLNGNLTVTVTNDYDFPIRITAVTAGDGNIVADAEHRDAGCRDARVRFTRDRFLVSWEVPRNSIGAFTIPAALTMRADAAGACNGSMFTVPIQASGVRLP